MRTFLVELPDDVVSLLETYAQADKRSRNNLIAKIIDEWLERSERKEKK